MIVLSTPVSTNKSASDDWNPARLFEMNVLFPGIPAPADMVTSLSRMTACPCGSSGGAGPETWRILELHPETRLAYVVLGHCYARKGMYPEAEAAFREYHAVAGRKK